MRERQGRQSSLSVDEPAFDGELAAFPMTTASGDRSLARVVVAEDDPDIRAVIVLALGRVGGLEVTACAHGRAVIDLVPRLLPDLFLLDVMMPEMDGLETLAWLKREPSTAAIPVIFMTARVRPRDLEIYHAQGALAVIAKPFDPMTLTKHLRNLYADSRFAQN
jgi:CheY-like chemotaxis protein